MANLSKIAYYSHDKPILKHLKRIDHFFTGYKAFSKNSTQALLIEHESFYVVAFGGSNDRQDWINNTDYRMIEYYNGKYHAGFHRMTKNVANEIISEIRTIDKPLYITGHSAGGAIAVMFAEILLKRGIKFDTIYTFGQPRLMSFSTAELFSNRTKGKYFRYQHNNDAACLLPPSWLGYSHAGQLVYIDSKGRIINRVGFFDRFIDSVSGLFKSATRLKIGYIQDHDWDEYINDLS